MKIKKGDKIIVITGKYQGEKGTVLKVLTAANRVLVEGIGKVKKHKRARRTSESGTVVEVESSVHASNIMVLDPKGGTRTRIGKKKVGEKMVRFAKKSGQEL